MFCSDSKKNSQFFRNFCEYIDCIIPRQTLFVWKKRILSGKNFHHTPNKLGRPQHYTELQKQRVVGMIINANLDNFVVDIEKVMDFFEEVTSRKPKSDYCRKFLKDQGFSLKKCGSKSSGFRVDLLDLREIYGDFVIALNLKGFDRYRKDLVCSFDFTFTSHRKDKIYSYTPVGG